MPVVVRTSLTAIPWSGAKSSSSWIFSENEVPLPLNVIFASVMMIQVATWIPPTDIRRSPLTREDASNVIVVVALGWQLDRIVQDAPRRKGNVYCAKSGFQSQRALPCGVLNVVASAYFPFGRQSTSVTALPESSSSLCRPPPREVIFRVDVLVPPESVSLYS